MLEFDAELVLAVVGNRTGHAVFRVVTLGRWRRFDRVDQASDAVTLIGLLLWIAAVVAVWAAFFP